jgi:hypothetical protein
MNKQRRHKHTQTAKPFSCEGERCSIRTCVHNHTASWSIHQKVTRAVIPRFWDGKELSMSAVAVVPIKLRPVTVQRDLVPDSQFVTTSYQRAMFEVQEHCAEMCDSLPSCGCAHTVIRVTFSRMKVEHEHKASLVKHNHLVGFVLEHKTFQGAFREWANTHATKTLSPSTTQTCLRQPTSCNALPSCA